jgi:hypothetical protein
MIPSTETRNKPEDMRHIAQRLESENPLWLVLFGAYSKEFVAFPRFAAPSGTIIAVRYPGAMTGRMREVEQAARIGQGPAARVGGN